MARRPDTARRNTKTALAAEDAALWARNTAYQIEELKTLFKRATLEHLNALRETQRLKQDLKNTRTEIAALRRAVLKSLVLMNSILDDPEARQHAEAVLKDTRIIHFKRD